MAQYRALYDYTPDEEAYSYMGLRVGHWLDKVKDIGNGWLMGFNTSSGDFGIFPASYVEKIEKLTVRSDIAGRLILLPDNPTAPPSQKVQDEIRRMKEAVNNDEMVNVEARSTIKIEPSPASESEDVTIEKVDMTALKTEINRQMMIKRTIEESGADSVQDPGDQPFISAPTLIETSLFTEVKEDPKPKINQPKPVVISPKPKIVKPKPKILAPKPDVSKPKPKIVPPKLMTSGEKPLISGPTLIDSTSTPVETVPIGLSLTKLIETSPVSLPPMSPELPLPPPEKEPVEQPEDIPFPEPPPPVHPKIAISSPVLLEPISDHYPVPLQPVGNHDNGPPPRPVGNYNDYPLPQPIDNYDDYPLPQPIVNYNDYPPAPSTPPVLSAPVQAKAVPIQPGSHPVISAPVLQEPIDNSYPVLLRPIEEQQAIVAAPPTRAIVDQPKTPSKSQEPFISLPVLETEAIQDPNRPIISAPIPIDDTSRPAISAPIPIDDPSEPIFTAPIPIPLTDHRSPDIEETVIDLPMETDKDTNALVSDTEDEAKPRKQKEKKVKEKKLNKEKDKKTKKEKKPKKVKEKKPPFDFQARLYGCIADCSAKNPLKTVLLGILGGLISGGIVFVLLAFSFNYDIEVAAWITLGVTLVFCFFLALSATFRCLVLLMVPTLVTGRGRAAILAFIFAILLTGPVINISSNAQEVSNSMACTSELIYNQTKALKHQLVEPLIKIAERINESFTEVKALADSLVDLIQPVINTIQQFQDAAQQAFDKLKELAAQCKTGINTAHTTCVSAINSAKTSCEDFFNSIDPTDDIVDGVKDIGKALGIGKRRKRFANDNLLIRQKLKPRNENVMLPQNVQLVEFLRSEIVHACKAKGQDADHCIESYFNRSRRGVLDNICTVLDISGLCGAIDIGGPVCDILDTFTNLANESVQEVKNLLDKITNFFVFGLNTTFDISGDINSSQTAEQIVDNVKADIVSKTDVILYYAKIIGQVLACSLILLLLKSFLYLHKWRAKEAFDNIYITKEFARYDEKRKKAGKEHVLPLKHREKRKYIVTRSILMAPTELETCQKGAVMIMRSLLIATIIIAIDYALYFLLVLIDTYGNINVNVSGTSTVTLTVEGNSIMAIVLRQLASAIAIDYDYSIDFNMTYCLPNAHEPDTSTIYLVVFLYLLAFVMMFMQAYGLRIRRKVAAHYYPEVEFDRIQYLHSKIRIKRRTLIGWIAHFLTSRRKEKDVSERMTLGSWFYYSCPYMASVFDCKPAKTICLNCDRESDGLMKFNICQTKGCESVYCSPCFKEMDERCPVCNKKYNF